MKYTLRPTTKFQKDLKKVQKQGKDIKLIKEVIELLAAGEKLPVKYKDHQLVGNFEKIACSFL